MMMATYEVMAENAFFWQQLRVVAADADVADKAFRAYLAAPAQQAAEAYELEQAKQMGSEDERELDRASYRYSFDDDDLVESFTDDASEVVRMVSSGGNG